MNNEEIQNLLQSLEDESDLDSIDDELAVDTVEQQLDSSDTEQDIYTGEDDSGDVSSEQYTRKDGRKNWKLSKSKWLTRTRARNISSEKPGVVDVAKTSKTPIACC